MAKLYQFHCDICNEDKTYESDITTGYGTQTDGRIACYECCARIDMDNMLKTGKTVLYLSYNDKKQYTVSNWPGSLKFPIRRISKGKHNIAHTRYDVWFSVYNQEWHGVQYGENTQLCHCKSIKKVRYNYVCY